MKSKHTGATLVYSTDPAVLRAAQAAQTITPALPTGPVRVGLDTKARRGRDVTVVQNLPLDATALTALSKRLKAACGTGGTVKDGIIEIQGDHREKVTALLIELGHSVKRAGGKA